MKNLLRKMTASECEPLASCRPNTLTHVSHVDVPYPRVVVNVTEYCTKGRAMVPRLYEQWRETTLNRFDARHVLALDHGDHSSLNHAPW